MGNYFLKGPSAKWCLFYPYILRDIATFLFRCHQNRPISKSERILRIRRKMTRAWTWAAHRLPRNPQRLVTGLSALTWPVWSQGDSDLGQKVSNPVLSLAPMKLFYVPEVFSIRVFEVILEWIRRSHLNVRECYRAFRCLYLLLYLNMRASKEVDRNSITGRKQKMIPA